MPDDTITLISTTDTPEQVTAALTGKPVEAPATPPPAAPVDEAAPPPAPPAEETPEERDTREASEAGSRLAKRKAKIQDEIDELTRSKHAVRRDVEAEEARLAALRAERPAIDPSHAPRAQAPPEPAVAAPPDETRPEPKLDALDDKGVAKYATYEDYLSDHAKWTREEAVAAAKKIVEQEKLAERERIERDSASRVVNEHLATYNTDLETFKKTHADFDAAFDDAKDAVQETLIGLGPNALKIIDGYTVFDAEDGPALTYYLLKHPDELKAIALKAPHQQVVHLARLDERLRSGTAKATGTSPAAPTPTRAPEPIKPVGSGPTATTVPIDEESFQDYKLRRERDLRARRA